LEMAFECNVPAVIPSSAAARHGLTIEKQDDPRAAAPADWDDLVAADGAPAFYAYVRRTP